MAELQPQKKKKKKNHFKNRHVKLVPRDIPLSLVQIAYQNSPRVIKSRSSITLGVLEFTLRQIRLINKPVNMPDPIRKRFRYGQCAARIGLDCTKNDRIILCKTGPGPIWMAWSGFGQTELVRKQVRFFQNSVDPLSVPTFRLGSVLPQTARFVLFGMSVLW